jgi:hypothetical protein
MLARKSNDNQRMDVVPLALSDEEFHQITALTQPLPFARRGDFIRELMAEIVAAGARGPATVRAIGQRLQIRHLGVQAVGPDDRD